MGRQLFGKTMKEQPILTEAQQQELLRLARTTLTVHLQQGYIPSYHTDDPILNDHLGTFVTLQKRALSPRLASGEPRMILRGCLGRVITDLPLYLTIQKMAVAATTDPRLPPLVFEELKQIIIEISVLSPLFPITDIQQIEIGQHGLILIRCGRRGALLPQVPLKHGWNRLEFLTHLCLKADLPLDAWTDNRAELYAFTTLKFSE